MLILAGLLFLTGCFFVPTFNPTVHGTNVAAKVGDATSKRPIRVGFATREQIIAMLGNPPYSDDSGKRIGYAWSVKNGVRIYPFCFVAMDQVADRGIELDFDEHDVLNGFKIAEGFKHEEGAPWGIHVIPSGGFTGRPAFDQAMHPNDEDFTLKNSQHRRAYGFTQDNAAPSN
jgi:hypothetical protein